VSAEIADCRGRHLQSLGPKQGTLQFDVSAVPAQFAGRGHDAMTRNVRPPAVAHDVSDSPCGAWPSGGFSNIAICGDATDRDAANHGQNGVCE
jgi:hypothetical protein